MSKAEIELRGDGPIVSASPIEVAIQTAAQLGKDGVEVLERLRDMMREEREEAAKRAFVTALARARSQFGPIKKTQQGQHTTRKGGKVKGNYAGLDDIAAVVDPVLHRHGFIYDWNREIVEGKEYIACTLLHSGGHSRSSRFPAMRGATTGKNEIQAHAEGETYAKRYSLVAVLGITTVDPDTDGGPSAESARLSDGQVANLLALCDEIGEPHVGKMLRWAGVDRVEDIAADRYAACVRALEAKR